ncbi:hypothetical protein DSO57_1038385 [Entomophthora muscae]|nr:hypothetical protein DSO57_1038385 [Entomophthora muscae]
MFFSMSRFQLVKSKFWLGFAAVLILNVSILMAFGICLFFGSELSSIPWKVVPFLIVAVGSENVLRITQAVVSTSLDLPVRERVGEGVRNCSLGITCHLGIELSVLTASYFSPNPTLSEFGIFGALAVVIDYFLQLTFFVAVLSIDIRRLELSDLQELKDHSCSETKKIRKVPRDSDESLLLAKVWESMVSQIEKMKTYSFFKFAMLGTSLFSAVFISRQLRQTVVFSYPQGLQLSGIDFPYQTHLDEKFWELINPDMSQLFLEVRPARRLMLTWSPSPDKLAALSQLSQPNKEAVRKPTFLTLLLLLTTGACLTMYLNILSKGQHKEKARWQSLDPRKSIRIFKEFWADVYLLESNGQELVAALSLNGELAVWNYHINRVWRQSQGEKRQRITSLAVSTHSWLAIGNSDGSVDFESLEDSSRNLKLDSLVTPGAAMISRLIFLPKNQNILAILADQRLFLYDIKCQTMLFSSEAHLSITYIHALPQAVFAGYGTGEVLAISLDIDADGSIQLTSNVIITSVGLPVTFLDAVDLDGRFRAILVGFKNSDCEVRMLSDINDLSCNLTLSAPGDAGDIIGLRLIAASDGFVATVSFATKSQITHVSHRNASGISPPISPGNFFLKTTSSAGVPSTGCPFTFTHKDTLIGLSRNSHQWELWGVSLSRGSLEDAVENRLGYSLVFDPLVCPAPDESSEEPKSDKIRPWVPFGFVSLPFVPLSENRGLGIALGNYIFCINPQLLLSSQED